MEKVIVGPLEAARIRTVYHHDAPDGCRDEGPHPGPRETNEQKWIVSAVKDKVISHLGKSRVEGLP